jgi:hypothetical protein
LFITGKDSAEDLAQQEDHQEGSSPRELHAGGVGKDKFLDSFPASAQYLPNGEERFVFHRFLIVPQPPVIFKYGSHHFGNSCTKSQKPPRQTEKN